MGTQAVVELSAVQVNVQANGQQLRLLRGVDFSLERGESVAIQGRSGCGKTTLLSTIGLMQPPDSGELRLLGRDVSRVGDAEAARLRLSHIGFVFQNYSLAAHLTVAQNVALPLRYARPRLARGEVRARVRHQLERVGLGDRLQARPLSLSGGEQQRVAVARALVGDPEVVLADEPTGALDLTTGAEVLALLLERVRSAQASLVVVTHDDDVAAVADRRLHLVEGRLEELAC